MTSSRPEPGSWDYYVLSQIVNGVIFGLIYALIALGLTVVFSIMRVVNFSHGEFYMLGGYAVYALTAGVAALFAVPVFIPTIVALPLAMAAVAIFGVASNGACCARCTPRAWIGPRSTPSS